MMWTGFIRGDVRAIVEGVDKPLGSTKCWLLKKDSAPWN
jgi:hypothetical protein